MTEPEPIPPAELTYRAPLEATHDFGLASWVPLLFFGVAEILGSGCFTAAVFAAFLQKLSTHPHSKTFLYRGMIAAVILYFAVPCLAAVAKLVCVPKIKRGSVPALLTAVVVTATEAAGGIVLLVFMTVMVLRMASADAARGIILLAILVSGLIAAWAVHAVVLFSAFLRDRKRRRAAGLE